MSFCIIKLVIQQVMKHIKIKFCGVIVMLPVENIQILAIKAT